MDDSKVYDVVIGNTTLHAITERDAYDLAHAIVTAIDKHTNHTTGAVF